MNDFSFDNYIFQHEERNRNIKMWLDYYTNSRLLVFDIFKSYNPDYPNYTKFYLTKEVYKE